MKIISQLTKINHACVLHPQHAHKQSPPLVPPACLTYVPPAAQDGERERRETKVVHCCERIRNKEAWKLLLPASRVAMKIFVGGQEISELNFCFCGEK